MLIDRPIPLNLWNRMIQVSQHLRMLYMSQIFFKNGCETNNYQLHLVNSLKFCDHISHKSLRPSQLPEKVLKILELFTLQKQIRQLPPTQSCSISEEQQHESFFQESQVIASDIDNGWRGMSLKIYARYCSFHDPWGHLYLQKLNFWGLKLS